MDFSIRLAKKNILIHSYSARIYKICEDYLVEENGKPDIEISIDEDMLLKEVKRIKEHDGEDVRLRDAEDLLIHRLIAEALLEYDTILMHGAVVSDGHRAYLFTAKSGTGKTTHIQKWLDNVEGSFVVNGDKPLIILNEDGAFACGTPWCGKEHLGTNIVTPLHSIVLMERSVENHIEETSFSSVFHLVLQQTHQPADADKMRKTLALLMKLKESVHFYRFFFDNYKDDCFKVAYDALTK
ncbi:MAG: hypothetical protein IJK71_11575 [Clostridia bacterium]|nr:hypothetical protein [Clostridia bacterium]